MQIRINAQAWNFCEYLGMPINGSENYLEFLRFQIILNTDNEMPWNF